MSVSEHPKPKLKSPTYAKFDKRIEGYTKILIKFGEKAAA